MKRGTKKQFFDSLVLAILLYAAETWVLKDHERKLIEKEYIRLARLAFSSWRTVGQDGKWETNEYFLKQNGLEELMKIVTRRKATWIGHLKRRAGDEWAQKFIEERNDELSEWWKKTKQELAECSNDDGGSGSRSSTSTTKNQRIVQIVKKCFGPTVPPGTRV